jgi:hypothetical protein
MTEDLAKEIRERAPDSSGLQLTDEQAAEVRRRLADPNRVTIPAEVVFGCYRPSRA